MNQQNVFADKDQNNEAFFADGQECSTFDKGSCGVCRSQLVK